RGLVKPLAVVAPDLDEPAAVPEALFTGRVLDDAGARDVLAEGDVCHFASLVDGGVGYQRCRRRGTGKLAARRPPSSPPGRRLYKMEVRQGAGRRGREGGAAD